VTTTEAVDKAFYVIFGISGLSLLGIIVAMVYFVWRYNRKRQPQPISQKDHNVWLEITWTVIPSILVMVMFWYGWEGYLSLRRIPDGAMPVTGTARMWSWLFTYENGKTADKLFVPVGQPVKVELIAKDVLHSFYVPAFRVKRDCVPGMPTYAWFVADKPGSYDLFCAEYCGVGHADMITTVEALPAEEFKAWLTATPATADIGRELLQKHGCLGCHSLDGSRAVGPSFQGIAGRQVTVVTAGVQRTLPTDRAYLKKSILEPGADIVEGYPPAMPPYMGRLPEEDLAGILDYLMAKTATDAAVAPEAAAPTESNAGGPAPTEGTTEATVAETKDSATTVAEPAAADQQEAAAGTAATAADLVAVGKTLAEQNGCTGCHSLDGSRMVGPSLKGLAGSKRSFTRNGQDMTATADFDYLARALREPAAEIAQGYPPAMPPYAHLSEQDIKALIAWLESLK
jgi:cytochrome c oxidase subunit 2